jgi:hypothetical protein
MSVFANLLKAAYQGGKGLIRAGGRNVDDVLRNIPLGGAPVRQSVGAVDDVSAFIGRSGQRLQGTRGAIETARNTGRSAPYVRSASKPSLRTPPKAKQPSRGQQVGLAALGLVGAPTGAFGLLGLEGSSRRRENEFNPGPLIKIGFDGSVETRNPMAATDPLAMRERYGGSGDMDAGDSATYSPSTRKYTFNSDTPPPPAPELPPPPTPTPAPNNLPPSPDQSMMDPYAYNLAVYGQGRNLATTKDERAAVRDLGLAINRKLFPKLNKTQDINPLMQATFPERYNSTLTGNIESRGTTLPGSMTEADSGSELATAQVQDTPYQAQFMRGMQEAQVADANRMVEQLLGQAEVDEIRRRLGM